MRPVSQRLAMSYSCVGHFFYHYFTAMYFTIVLSLQQSWPQSYETLLALWTPAAIVIGLASLPAGRLADRWSSPGMLVVMFLGMGIATAACGFVNDPAALTAGLIALGLFGAIYHPVGIPWLIKNTRGNTGTMLGLNGIFGGLGSAAAGALTGLLIGWFDWRLAFMIPGVLCALTGVAMLHHVRAGRVVEGGLPRTDSASGGRGRGNLLAFGALLLPMFAIGLIYNATQASMPKLFEEQMPLLLNADIGKIGLLVGVVYSVGAFMQLLVGRLADRYPVKTVYLLAWAAHVPLLVLAAVSGESLLFLAAMLLVIANTGALPAENILLSRFAPPDHQGLAFGIKFVLAFGASPIGIWLVALSRSVTGDFSGLLLGLAVLAGVTVLLILFAVPQPRPLIAEPAEPAGA